PTSFADENGNVLEPMKGKQWEAGVKYEPLGGNSQFSAAVYRINECFKDIGLAHILGTPEVPEGTQLIHRVECPYGPLVEEKLD
ncbi:TonB-dependent receptor, partial [Salmonella enterica subsp. enterica serovar Kentucky]|nr:TonB-dependent receptor [Salmonella enterica subsp. enterica serovar Kentucky]